MFFPDLENLLIVSAFLGLIPGFIAKSKGRDFFPWYVYGVLIFIVAFIHSLVIQKTDEMKKEELTANGYFECPYCKELVKPGATVCPHCQRDISAIESGRLS